MTKKELLNKFADVAASEEISELAQELLNATVEDITTLQSIADKGNRTTPAEKKKAKELMQLLEVALAEFEKAEAGPQTAAEVLELKEEIDALIVKGHWNKAAEVAEKVEDQEKKAIFLDQITEAKVKGGADKGGALKPKVTDEDIIQKYKDLSNALAKLETYKRSVNKPSRHLFAARRRNDIALAMFTRSIRGSK